MRGIEIPGPREIVLQVPAKEGEDVELRGEALETLLLRGPHRGEIVTVKDPKGREFRGRIVALGDTVATLHLFEELKKPTEPPFDLWLLQALPDKERMELIIQKATELGVKVIVPFKSSRSISLEEREARQPKAHRWGHVALKATKQCRRAYLPYVAPYCRFEEALKAAEGFERKLMLYEGEGRSLASAIRNTPPPSRVALLVGPEGGWDQGEVKKARASGFTVCGLGGRILRTETAAIAACAILMYEWGGLA